MKPARPTASTKAPKRTFPCRARSRPTCAVAWSTATVREADRNFGTYDADKLQPIIETCVQTELVQ